MTASQASSSLGIRPILFLALIITALLFAGTLFWTARLQVSHDRLEQRVEALVQLLDAGHQADEIPEQRRLRAERSDPLTEYLETIAQRQVAVSCFLLTLDFMGVCVGHSLIRSKPHARQTKGFVYKVSQATVLYVDSGRGYSSGYFGAWRHEYYL